MSRLTRRLQEIDAHQRRIGIGKAVEHHLGEAGDALELAARVATGAYRARDVNPDESDVFRLGYLTACLELAVVLRCMRAGRTPEPGEMQQARVQAAEALGQERPVAPPEPKFDELGWLRRKVGGLAKEAEGYSYDRALDADEEERRFRRLQKQLEMALRGEEWTSGAPDTPCDEGDET